MEALATLNNQRQFDFQNNGIEVMDLETLSGMSISQIFAPPSFARRISRSIISRRSGCIRSSSA